MNAEGISGQVFNIACGQQTSVNTLHRLIQKISGREVPPRYENPRRGEVRHSLADINLAKASLGYEVRVGLEAGLKDTWEWFKVKSKVL